MSWLSVRGPLCWNRSWSYLMFVSSKQHRDAIGSFCITNKLLRCWKQEQSNLHNSQTSIHYINAKVKSFLVLHELCSHKMETFCSANRNTLTDSDTKSKQSHWFIRWDCEVVWSVQQIKYTNHQMSLVIVRNCCVLKQFKSLHIIWNCGNSRVMSRVHSQFFFLL